MFKVRDDEPQYAFLRSENVPETNQYGKKIQLVDETDPLAKKSLRINNDEAVSENPDRYKQHGFYFNADNCISCHACESACSEKNNLPPYLAYRAVGYVEGGSYPSYTRLNISMACNHCDNPVCLKGCPTRAYTKFAEYGAVLQDPDICFGCGYCTWVCPYNAPQLDREKGHVHKCNMCVDRLEAGLKPACASACLAGALDFGVVETTPENREQLKTQIPGFPTTDITHPNIRFQQTRSLPREMTRTDATDLKYVRRDDGKGYDVQLNENRIKKARQWNLKKLLSTHENAHIAFTISTQAVMGAFLMFLLGNYFDMGMLSALSGNLSYPFLFVLVAIMSFGMLRLNLHLGRPQRFYRGFYNLRYSPVSREIAGVSLFFAGLAGYTFFNFFDNSFTNFLKHSSAVAAVVGGIVGFYYMYKLYRIPARPFWNHWQTGSSFLGTALTLGTGLLFIAGYFSALETAQFANIIPVLSYIMLAGLLLEGIGLIAHARRNRKARDEGTLSHHEQSTVYGKSYLLRNFILAGAVVLSALLLLLQPGITLSLLLMLAVVVLVPVAAIIGRALFYVLVIPTTMPGAFFWRNRGFEEHARETGLADMQQVGVLNHH